MPRIRAASIAEHKTLTRSEILEAAASLFRTQGYNDTSLGDIAGYIGIGRTTLYEYFSDKEDLLSSLVEERIPTVMDEIVDGVTGATSRERLADLLIRALNYISSEDDLGVLLMRATPRLEGEAQLRIRAAHSRLEEEISRLCEEGVARGEFRPFDPVDVRRLVFAVMWSASRALLRDIDAKQRRHEVAETLVEFIFDGLAV